MKSQVNFDICSFILGGLVGMLLDFAGSVVAVHSIEKRHKHTGGSFRELYEDNNLE